MSWMNHECLCSKVGGATVMYIMWEQGSARLKCKALWSHAALIQTKTKKVGLPAIDDAPPSCSWRLTVQAS